MSLKSLGRVKTRIKRLSEGERQAPSFTSNVLYQFAGRVIAFILGIATSIIVARWLGPEGKGIVSTLQTFLGFFGGIALLGLPTALQYNIANKSHPIGDIIGVFCHFVLSYYFPLTFILIFLAPYLTSSFLKGVPSLLLIISLLISLLTTYLSPLGSSLSALRRFNYVLLLGVLSSFLRLALLSLFLILLKWGVWGAFASDWSLLPLNLSLGFLFVSDVIHPRHFLPRWNKEIFSQMLKYGLAVFLSGMLWQVNARFDVFVVNSFLGASAVGLYMTGVNYSELMRLFSDSVNSVLFPQISSSSPQESRKLTSFLTRSLPLYYLPLAPLFLLLAPLVIPLFFGSAFHPSISVIPYLLPGIIAWMYLGCLWNHFSGRGYPRYNLYSSLGGSILTLILDFLLIPRWGIVGASIASSLAYSLTLLVALYFFKKLEGIPLRDIFLTRKEDIFILWDKAKEIKRNMSKKKDG